MEQWNGMVEWTTGMEYWNAPSTVAPHKYTSTLGEPGDAALKVAGVLVWWFCIVYVIQAQPAELPR